MGKEKGRKSLLRYVDGGGPLSTPIVFQAGQRRMSQQRFRTNMQWHNTLAAFWLVAAMVLVGVILLALHSQFTALWVLVIASVMVLVVAIYRDRGNRCTYVVEKDRLTLMRFGERLQIPLDSILDASLVDRRAARAYFRDLVVTQGRTRGDRKALQRGFLRYCTVEIGLSPFHFDRRGHAERPGDRYDLVLIRTKDHGVRLLSPAYNQALITALMQGALTGRKGDQL